MRHPLFRAIIGERKQRAAIVHELFGALGNGCEGIDTDEHRLGEVVGAGVDVAACELILVGEGDAVDDEIECAPFTCDGVEGGVHGGRVGDVTGDHDLRAKFSGERLDALLEGVALIGEGKFGTLGGTGLGDAPGNGPVVRNTHDEAALASHQTLVIAHFYPSDMWRSRAFPGGRLIDTSKWGGPQETAPAGLALPLHGCWSVPEVDP